MANAKIPCVFIEVQMGIFTGENNSFLQGIRASVENKGFFQKKVLVMGYAFKSTRVSSV